MSHVDEGTLHALVDSALDDVERAAVEAHLASCASCAKQFAEASAMARQVVTLLGALDDVAPPVTVRASSHRSGSGGDTVRQAGITPIRQRIITLRRVALAASVLLVAGVSYEVGRTSESAQTPAAGATNSTSVRLRDAAVPLAASVASAAADSFGPPAPTAVASPAPRGGPRAESDAPMAEQAPVASDVALAETKAAPAAPMPATTLQVPASQEATSIVERSQASDAQTADRADGSQRSHRRAPATAQEQVAQRLAPPASPPAQTASAATPAVAVSGANAVRGEAATKPMSGGAILPKAAPLAGYAMVEDVALPTLARRRYVAPDGTSVLLVVIRGLDDEGKERRAAVSNEFVVSTVRGRSIVRWRAQGLDYELQGTIGADSLMKLAVQFR